MRPSNNMENKIPLDTYWKSSASMYESSGSQFFRNTTGIKSGTGAVDESTLVISVFFLECTKMYFQYFQKNTILGIISPNLKILV